ncbi:MAG: 2-isopropylmalate synthase, partial [Clostridiales bacterium]|nr:2-isopropylmalate synthase [Clostridiales bacterium]
MASIKILDTTLRDGEQSPGCSMNLTEKIEIARNLQRLGVDIIETGFAAASPGDLQAVKTISGIIRDCSICSLARATQKDIDIAWEGIRAAVEPRIHIFLATSPVHMKYKLKMSPDDVIRHTADAVKYAKIYCSDIEFSAEDAGRSDWSFLVKVFETAIKNGATVLNVPDTVGYMTPEEIFKLFSYLKNNVKGIENVTLSTHNHDDLGLATANTLAAIRAGARQAELTINGIGERAGNASLEEVVMSLETRKSFYNIDTNINTRRIYRTSRLVQSITGFSVPP